jgi:serine/threonine-protein kinase
MAPEQARGEVEATDERADVFALGSILCEILTSQPAFTGDDPVRIEVQAARGDVADAHRRLNACGADRDLTELASNCLAVDKACRPRTAREVAGRITAYRMGVQEKLKAAELAAVEAQARAEEEAKRRSLADQLASEARAHATAEQRRRRLTVALAASMMTFLILGGGATAWTLRDRQVRLARLELALKQVEVLLGLAESDREGNLGKWRAAETALQPARDLIAVVPTRLGQSRLADLQGRIEEGVSQAEANQNLLERLDAIRSGLDADREADRAYEQAFRERDPELDPIPSERDPAEVGRRIASLPNAVRQAAVTALDAWAVVSSGLARAANIDGRSIQERLLTVAKTADPDPWRNQWRDAWAKRDPALLKALARDPGLQEKGPVALWLLGFSLQLAGDRELALGVLRKGQRTYPDDYWLNNELGNALLGMRRLGPGPIDSVVFYEKRDTEYRSAEPYMMAAVALRPTSSAAHLNLSNAFGLQGRYDEAVRSALRAISLKPDNCFAVNGLGVALSGQGKPAEARAAFREAIRLQPWYALAHVNLGASLLNQEKLEEAIAESREAIRLWPGSIHAQVTLCRALAALAQFDEAIATGREACRLQPSYARACASLATALRRRGDYQEAVLELRKAAGLSADAVELAQIKHELGQTERYSVLAPRLEAVLRGDDKPKSPAEILEFANLALDRARFAGSVGLYAQALKADPELARNPYVPNRYNAACAAAVASSCPSKDAPKLAEPAQADLRGQCRRWLEEDLQAWSKKLNGGVLADREQTHRSLERWKVDHDLAGIRDSRALARLSETEQKSWQALWEEYERLLAMSQSNAEIPPELAGRWQGKIERIGGGWLRAVVRVEADEDDRLTAVLESPDQSSTSMPISSTTLKDGVWSWYCRSIDAQFEGKAEESRDVYVGSFRQPRAAFEGALTLRRSRMSDHPR